MQSIPLPAIEFVGFMTFAVWLFFWQGKSSRRADRAAEDDAAEPTSSPVTESEEGEHGASGR